MNIYLLSPHKVRTGSEMPVTSMDDDIQQSHLLHQDHFTTFSPLLGASQTYTLFYNHTVLRTVVVGVFQSWSLLRKWRRRLFS